VVLAAGAAVEPTIRGAARNLLFAAKFAANEPIIPPPWAQVLMCDANAENGLQIGACRLPILACRRASADIGAARAACDRLQYDLAPMGDFAGYLV
jgi:hypothetical protein